MTETMYPIAGPWAGKLAILPRPRGGEWLVDEVRTWQQAGFDIIVSLLTSSENEELDLDREQELVTRYGLQFFSFAIPDRGTPASVWEARTFVDQLEKLLSARKNVGVHCRQGVGRSALLAASLLAQAGVDVDTAFERIKAARGCSVPDTVEQRQWVERFAALEALPVL